MASVVPKRDPYYDQVLGTATTALIVIGDPTKTKTNLVNEADRLSRLVVEQSSSIPLTEACSKLLEEAHGLLATDPLNAGTVLGKFEEVKQLLLRAHESRNAWKSWGIGLLLWNTVWFVGILYTVLCKTFIPGEATLEKPLNVFLACALWGGIGGVVDAYFALHTHFGRQRFDTRLRTWYFLHPILGVSLGAAVFLIMQAGLLAVSGATLAEAADDASLVGTTTLPIALAFLAGFKQNTAIGLLNRVVKSIFQSE